MAEFKPNKQQQEFLDVGKCNVLVSASAGSGKTSTMIHKLSRIISTEHMPITSLLVVTYTNAAASEIKLKLFNELTSLINATSDLNEKSYLQEQLNNINNAEIGTLHAICKKLIVKYFYKINESPNFSLLSDKEEKYLLDSAVKNVFNRHITNNYEDFFELYDCYNSKRSDIQLKAMCLSLYNYKCAKTDYIEWKNNFLNSSYNLDINSNLATTYLLEYYQKLFLMFSSQIMSLRNSANILGLEKYVNYLNARLQFVDEINKVGNFETSIKILANLKFPSKPVKSKNASIEESDFDDDISVFNTFFGDLIKRCKEDMTSLNVDEIVSSIDNAKNNVIKLMNIVDEIEVEYSRLKKNKNALDFNDLENKMLLLLEDEEIRDTLSQKYSYVFVDEYQDINDKQENILLKIVSEDNYYMIGDVKQSIYAFRQSSPKIFVSKYNSYSSEQNNNRLINFNANYRSDRNILEFANSVFDKIITRETIGIDYAGDARFITEKEFNGCNITLNLINNNDDLEDKDYSEALIIAREISRITTLARPDGSKYRYGDIAVILRQRGSFVRLLCDLLTSMQIPVTATVNSDFFNTSEIGLLMAILQVVSNYKSDLAMTIVLKNLFDVNEEELMTIRNFDDNLMFNECVVSYNGCSNIENKIKAMFEFIQDSRIQLTNTTIKDYLMGVIDKFDVVLRFRAGEGGKEKESNILEFLRIADNENYKYNLDKFLDYLEFISKEKSLQSLGADTDAVQICTIHHSKGLEYPAVILGGLGRKFQLNKDSGNIIINNKFGVGLKSIDNQTRTLNETVIRNACKIDNEKSEIDEEIRLLYVAMTRAKELLSMVGTYDISTIASNKIKRVYSSKNYFDLIFKSIDNSYLSYFMNKSEFMINENLFNCAKVNIFNPDDFEDEENNKTPQIILNAMDNELLSKLSMVYSKVPNIQTTTIKNTVTNILKEESDYENINYNPKKLDVTDEVVSPDYLKVGTAYHTVMQALTFKENRQEIQSLISRLVSEGQLDGGMVKYINIDHIYKAVDVLGDLILKSNRVYREKQFILRESYNKLIKSTDNNTKVIVQGVIDLVLDNDDGVYIIDYKTNRGVSAEELVDKYRLQLEIYAQAFELATGKSVNKKFLYSFSLGQLINIG